VGVVELRAGYKREGRGGGEKVRSVSKVGEGGMGIDMGGGMWGAVVGWGGWR